MSFVPDQMKECCICSQRIASELGISGRCSSFDHDGSNSSILSGAWERIKVVILERHYYGLSVNMTVGQFKKTMSLKGKYWFRIAIYSHKTKREQIHQLRNAGILLDNHQLLAWLT